MKKRLTMGKKRENSIVKQYTRTKKNSNEQKKIIPKVIKDETVKEEELKELKRELETTYMRFKSFSNIFKIRWIDSKTKDEVWEKLENIYKYDDNAYNAILEAINHINNTCSDKYSASPLQTKDLIYHESTGMGFNMGNAAKYIQRYITKGFEKSYQIIDIKKAVHYLIFELGRRIEEEKVKNTTIFTHDGGK